MRVAGDRRERGGWRTRARAAERAGRATAERTGRATAQRTGRASAGRAARATAVLGVLLLGGAGLGGAGLGGAGLGGAGLGGTGGAGGAVVALAGVSVGTAVGGEGNGEQWTVIPVPSGGWVALLDRRGKPVTATTFRGQGTYTLDPATGEITFTPRAAFYGTPRAVTYQLTDAAGRIATGTYQPTVPARPIPAVRAAERTLTSVDAGTARIGCTAGPVAVQRCEVTLSAVVNGELVTLGSGSAETAAGGGQIGTLNVDLALTAHGRRLAGVPGGWPAQVAVSVWLPGNSEALQATGATQLTARNVTAPRPIRYGAGQTALPDADLPYLNALRARMSDVATVTCTGDSTGQGSPAADRLAALDRAKGVCDYLTANMTSRAVVVAGPAPASNGPTPGGPSNGLTPGGHTSIVFTY